MGNGGVKKMMDGSLMGEEDGGWGGETDEMMKKMGDRGWGDEKDGR